MRLIYSTAIALLLVTAFAGYSMAAEWGEIREASQNLNVRQERTVKSEHVVTLAKGQHVKVDFIKDGWAAIFNLNESVRDEKRAIGFANAKFLTLVPDNKSAGTTSKTVAPSSGEGEIKATVAAVPPAAVEGLGSDPESVPVQITSDRMIYDENNKMVSFVGNVVATHGELTLWANKLSAYLASKSGKKFSAGSIDRIVAEGNVKAKRGNSSGSCGKLTYFVEKQLLKMEDNPTLQDGPNSLTGNIINFYVRENRSEVVGGKNKRVRAIFMTPESVKVP